MSSVTSMSLERRAMALVGAAFAGGWVLLLVVGHQPHPPQIVIFNLRPPILQVEDQAGIIRLSIAPPPYLHSLDPLVCSDLRLRLTSHAEIQSSEPTIGPLGALIEVKIGGREWTTVQAPGIGPDGICSMSDVPVHLQIGTNEPWNRHSFRARWVISVGTSAMDRFIAGQDSGQPVVLIFPGIYPDTPVRASDLDAELQHHLQDSSVAWPFRPVPDMGHGVVYSDPGDEQVMTPTSSIRFVFLKSVTDPTTGIALGAEMEVNKLVRDTTAEHGQWLPDPVSYKLLKPGDPLIFEKDVTDPQRTEGKKRKEDFMTPYTLVTVVQDVRRIEYYEIRAVSRADGGQGKDLRIVPKETQTDAVILKDGIGRILTLPKLAKIQRPPHPGVIMYPDVPMLVYDERQEFAKSPVEFRQWGLVPMAPIDHLPGTGPLENWRILKRNERLRTDTDYFELADGRLVYWDTVDRRVAIYPIPGSEADHGLVIPMIERRTSEIPDPGDSYDRWPSSVGHDQYGYWSLLQVGRIIQRMRWIPPGTFRMGSPVDEAHRMPDEVLHDVKLSHGYWLAESACTQALWTTVMDSHPSYFGPHLSFPVEGVSAEDVDVFLNRLDRRLKAPFTLPTEAQREYACRAGSVDAYPGHYLEVWHMFDVDALGWYDSNSWATTHAVRGKQPNPWGLYDMHGNVWEWCLDWKADYPAGPVTDPRGPATGTERVLRGGSWSSPEWTCRSANRRGALPIVRSNDIGFRLCVTASDGPPVPDALDLSPALDSPKP